MKKIFLPLFFAGVFACTPKYDGYTIQGSFTGVDSALVILSNRSQTERLSDTVQMVQGKFTIKNKLVTPEMYTLTIQTTPPVGFPVYLENCEFIITGDIEKMKDVVIVGGPYQTTMDSLAKEKNAIAANYPSMEDLQKEFTDPATTNERKQELRNIANEVYEKQNAVETSYISSHPTSLVALSTFFSTVKYDDVPLAKLEQQLAAFKAVPEYANNRYVREIEEDVNAIKAIQVGMKAPDFTMNDPDGNPVKLSDVYPKNKVTMIDFWAAWCGPCRAFNPTLVKIYKDFEKKGFGILGVSFDRSKEAWIKAIADDKLTWLQVSDLQYWQNAAGKLYHVSSIPQNIFVDQNGIIVARRLEGDKINEFLTDFLNKK